MGGWYEGCPWHCPGLPGTTFRLLTPGLAWPWGRGARGSSGVWRLGERETHPGPLGYLVALLSISLIMRGEEDSR